MKMNMLLYFASIVFISEVVLSTSTCLNGMNEISLSNLATSIQKNSIYYFHQDKILTSPLEINMEIKIQESVHASLILSKANPKFFGFKTKHFLEIGIDSTKKGQSKIFLNVKKTPEENGVNSHDKGKKIELDIPIQNKMGDSNEILDKETELHHPSIKLSFLIEKNEFKILYAKDVVLSEPIDVRKVLGNYAYIFLESSKDIIKDFSICYSKTSPESLRNLEESTETQLEYIEVDEYSIKTSPNILKGGNVVIIPNVKLNPKDSNGNFPSSLLSWKPKNLRTLFNVTHSKNVSFYYQVGIVSKKQLIIILGSDVPGEIYISSKYFKNDITYVISINNTELVPSETSIEIDEETLINGDNSKIKIIPKNKYQNPMTFIDESDIKKFQVTISLPNKTVIQAETGEFNPKEKAIIFNPILNFIGEAVIEVKYGDDVIPCQNCNINVNNYEIDWQQTKIEYSESIKLGEISNLTIYPKDKNGKELKAGTLLKQIEIKCIFDNKSLEVISEVNQENTKIEIYNKENITNPGTLTWQIIYGDDVFIYNVSITEETSNPNPNYSEIIFYTNQIYEDIQPIQIYLALKDDNSNYIYRKDIVYKRQLFIMNEDELEKPEQNIDFDEENKTYILSFNPDYNNISSFNLSIYFNNSNELFVIKNNIIVQIKIKTFLEDEELVTDTVFTPGIALLYENEKVVNLTFDFEDDEDGNNKVCQDLEARGDFLLYIKDINYEKSENNTKLEYYTAYLAILQLTNRNSSDREQKVLISDKKLIDIYRQITNKTYLIDYFFKKNSSIDYTGFIKFEFYENGEIKQMYYPQIDSFNFKSFDYINETISLIIPKISPHLFSQDIHSKFNEIQKDINEDDPVEEKRNILLRRLKEINPKKRKKNQNKIKKIRYRILQEDSSDTTEINPSSEKNESYIVDEILPIEDEIDYTLREIKDNGDNTSNITLLSIGDVESNQAKITGSLDNRTVMTKIDDNGKVLGIYQVQQTHFVSGVRDPDLDEYIYNNTYTEDSYFKKDDFIAENETQIINEGNPMNLKSMDADNHNIIFLLDDFYDNSGQLMEYFTNVTYEIYNETVHLNYILDDMGPDFLDRINGSNISISITDEFEEDTNSLRSLDSNTYPYYGQKIVSTVKDIYEKHFLGITIRSYTETTIYPDTGITLVETINVFGALKKVLASEKTYSNNHIVIKNKNAMSNDLINFIDKEIKLIRNYTAQLTDEYSKINNIIINEKPYTITYDTLLDDFVNQFIDSSDVINGLFLHYYTILNDVDGIGIRASSRCSSRAYRNLSNIKSTNRKKVESYYRANIDFNYDVLELIKNYEKSNPNISLELLQEISEEIEIINDYFEDNITQFISSYQNDLSALSKFENSNISIVLKNRSDEYNIKLEDMISALNLINLTIPKLISMKNVMLKNIRKSVYVRFKDHNDILKDFKKDIRSYSLDSRDYKNIFNNLKKYLENKQITLISQIYKLKKYLEPIYKSLHNFLFNFYKGFSDEIFNSLDNLEFDNYTTFQKTSFEIIENILSEYKKIAESSSDNDIEQYKKQIDEYLSEYNKTVSTYLYNVTFDKLIQNYNPSSEFLEIFNETLREITSSFESYQDYKSFQEYPKELDYIILSLTSFKNELKEIFEEINKYAYEVILYQIDLLNDGNSEYIYLFAKSDKNYLFSNLDKIEKLSNYINVTKEKTMLENFFPNSNDEDYDDDSLDNISNEILKNFSFIKENTLNMFDSMIADNINKMNKSRMIIYNYYYQIKCGFDCATSNHIEDENLRNSFMRMRLEMLTSYLFSFTENLSEIYNEEDINNLLIPEIDFDEFMESYFISELNQNSLDYVKTDFDDLYRKIDSDIYTIKETYDEVNYTDILLDFGDILENKHDLFLNLIKTQFFRYNETIYSLIEKYKDILYRYIDDYNYTIISFDIYQNYFDKFLKNITQKYQLIDDKIRRIKGYIISYKIYSGNIIKDSLRNMTSYLNQRKNNFTDFLKNNDVNYKIIDQDFILSEYILEKLSEYDENNLNQINNFTKLNISGYIKTMSELIYEFDKPINNLLKNITEEFLIQFKNGENITQEDKEDAINAYENDFNLKNNNTYRKCWNLRGKFFSEVKTEDYIKYNEYLDYMNKIQIIEECEAKGDLFCPYKRADLEKVEYTNLTQLYTFCDGINKIYGGKESIFYSMEDLDVEELNEINNIIMNILDEIFNFDKYITDYIYMRFGLNAKQTMFNETINIEEILSKVNNTVNDSISDIQEKYDDYIMEEVYSKLQDISQMYQTVIYMGVNVSFSIMNEMKNTFFVNHYFPKYQLFKDLFEDLIKNMTYISKFFKTNLKDTFPEIEEDLENYLSIGLKENFENKIFNYYENEFPNIFIESYFNLTKEKVNEENSVTYLKENINNIINKSESNSQHREVISGILYSFASFNSIPFGFNATIGEKKIESVDNLEIENILNKMTSIDIFLQKRELFDDYEQLKKQYIYNRSLVHEPVDLEAMFIPYINESIYDSFDLNDPLIRLTDELKKISQVSYDPNSFPDFFSIAYNKSFDFYKDCYSKINQIYLNMIKIIGNVSIYNNTDNIDDKFGKLVGYAMIDRLAYLDPVCNGEECPFKIDMIKSKEEIKQNLRRRLSENRFEKEVKEVVRILKEMRDMNKNYSDYIYENMADQKRKLSDNYNYEIYETYDSTCPERGNKEVEMMVSLLKTTVDDLNEKFYYYSKTIETDVAKKFKDELNVLENKYFKYLNILEKLFSAGDYRMIESNFTNLMYKLNNYVNNITGTITSASKKYVDIINNFYSSHQITGEMISSKIIGYYTDLESLISTKCTGVKDEEYSAASSYINKQSSLQKQYEIGKTVLLQNLQLRAEIEVEIKNDTKDIWGFIEEEDEKEIMDKGLNDYGWDDADNDNEKWDESDKNNYMTRRKQKKNEQLEDELEQEEKQSSYVKKTKELRKKMDDLHLKFESEIKVNWDNLLETTVTTEAGYEKTDEIKFGWQHPFVVPMVPIVQFRLGFKVSIYFRITLGILINIGGSDPDKRFELKVHIEFRVGAKLDLIAEGGLYGGIAKVVGGIEGTLFDANVGLRLYVYILDGFHEIYINLSINAIKIRGYAETEIDIYIYKSKLVLFEKEFGLKVPLLNMYYYLKVDFWGQVLESEKDSKTISDYMR